MQKHEKDVSDLMTQAKGKLGATEAIVVLLSMEASNARMNQVRDWYQLRVLEELEEESRRLRWLTVALLGLTATLAVFTALLLFGIRL